MLNTTGVAALWKWVNSVSHSPESQSQDFWIKEANLCIGIAAGIEVRVCMPARLTRSGYLESLVLHPKWYAFSEFNYYREISKL